MSILAITIIRKISLQKKLLISLLLLLLSVCIGSFAGGLRLFSYKNNDGQTIIVDRIERVPKQFRDRVTTGFIPAFKQSESATINNSSVDTVPPIPTSHDNHLTKPLPKSDIRVIEPPVDIEKDPEVIKANSITKTIRDLSASLENTYGLAASIGLTHPNVSQINNNNIHKLQNITPPASVNWEEAKAWKDQATQIIPQLRTMLLTVSRAVHQNSTQILSKLPDFITRLNFKISQIEKKLKKAKEELKANLAQE